MDSGADRVLQGAHDGRQDADTPGCGAPQHPGSERDAGRPSRWLLPYIACVDAAGVTIVLVTLPSLAPGNWPALLLFMAFAALAESWTVPISKHGEVSLCFIAVFAAAVLFGPCFGALAAAGGSIIADALVRRKGAAKTAFNAGQFAVAGGLAGLAFALLQSDSSYDLVTSAIAYTAAAIVFVAVNSALASVVIAMLGRRFLSVWTVALREGGVLYLAMAPMGALLANAYTQSAWALLYFPLLVWVVYKGFGLYAKLRTETKNALVALADSLDRRDPYTFQHSLRVAGYARQIAVRMGLPGEELELIVSAAQVHDLGKISIDNRILFKEGRLTDEERRQVNTHSAAGAEQRSSDTITNGGTAVATPTASRARRFRSARGSSRSPTSTTL
jgi:uncharacterized membrane protein